MRCAPLPAALFAACVISGAPGLAAPAALSCPATEDALTGRLCAAIYQELSRRGVPGGDADPSAPHLTLTAHSPHPQTLLARLTPQDGATRREGAELTLSVMDRASIPDRDLQQFARLLLDQVVPGRD